MDKRILVYDIEVSYITGATWVLYDATVVKVLKEPYIISYSAHWLGTDEHITVALNDFELYKTDPTNDIELVKELHDLFDKADVIIAHNGNAFDQKWCYGRFAVHNMKPPSPSQYIDTMLVCKKNFKFPSYSLNNIARYFGIEEKMSTGGIDLWIDCIENKYTDAWDRMKRYNKQDVVVLEKVYLHIRPYITNHPNMGLITGVISSCPSCGSIDIIKRGYKYTRTVKRQQYSCHGCGAWASGETIPLEGVALR